MEAGPLDRYTLKDAMGRKARVAQRDAARQAVH
jgi:hypothetical protein